MTPLETLTLAAYFFILIVLAGYGWHRYYLVYAYMKNRDRVPVPLRQFDELPAVTVQLPVYNEMYVVDRLIESVCQMDYPRDKFEVQVLDDSVDETQSMASLAVRRFAAQGIDVKYYHRTDRRGYKAGALEEGLKVARGEFVGAGRIGWRPGEAPRWNREWLLHAVRRLIFVARIWRRVDGASTIAAALFIRFALIPRRHIASSPSSASIAASPSGLRTFSKFPRPTCAHSWRAAEAKGSAPLRPRAPASQSRSRASLPC